MNNPISIADAKAWTKKWQDDNPNHAKAFSISIDDLLACISQLGLTITKNANGIYESDDANAKIRAYMGIDVNNLSEGFGEKLVYVATVLDNGSYKDVVEDGSYPASGIRRNGSGAFDFTNPCPNYCDKNSSLYH
ncbi:hypothetical protein [Psychroserpens sp.]|uniref:hypothetical protein n=1 Tax=Psychroserpens sp. TaxID=2020870 RepID=UPI001B04E3C9|nr:hypothetical protein [Psychroserpens sp.]MBO6605638.1 hypothetical protein [Psychroserpens sp.]MBO6631821.1 hypothetical protein [Psychroserpens sp.]MBO6653553.1 hypothetical protein [Psychroserpens sp.]MBO6681874.1 hypothetical protein [Psychroserpens sp.]MBO6749012.1 hypothetical protein [Psychroserpens sp.]